MDLTLYSKTLFFMKSRDKIIGFFFSLTSNFSITFPSSSEFILQVNTTFPFWRIIKSLMFPFLRMTYSGWQIFLSTISAKFSKLFLDRLLRKPSPSNKILLASIRYSLWILLGRDSKTSSWSSYSNCSFMRYYSSIKLQTLDSSSF